MLEKAIHFKNGLPVDAFLSTVENIPLHVHQTIEFIMVLEGTLEIREAYQSQILNDGDIHIFNPPDLHCINGLSQTNCVLTLYIDLEYLTKNYSAIKNISFLCDCDNQKGSSIELLRRSLADIYFHFSENQYGDPARLKDDLDSLVTLLQDSFQLFRWLPDGSDHFFYGCPQEYHINAFHAERIRRVQEYIYSHYAENITLSDLAQHEYLSTYYLSHFIRQATGLSFQQWLSAVRSEAAEKLLVSTDKNISDIALEAGFASTKYLISHFKKWYGATPSKYREITAAINSQQPHKYYSCDRMKAEKLLNSHRYESHHSGKDVQKGSPISKSLEKGELPQKSDTAKLQHYMNLLLLSGEIYAAMFHSDGSDPIRSISAEALMRELSMLPAEVFKSYEAFLAEIMRCLNILPQKDA
ncbi:MAG: AraC family transcriptional regulator [Eubacteriales bacterium]|nr:AraC family transcriptional regulator [Eubacteriales bacterium]